MTPNTAPQPEPSLESIQNLAEMRVGDVVIADGKKRIVTVVDAEGFDADEINPRKGNTGRGIYAVWHPQYNVYGMLSIDVPATAAQITQLRSLPRWLDTFWQRAIFIAPQLLAESINVLYVVDVEPKVAGKVVLA